MTDTLTLYGHPDSGHAYKVRLALALARIAHDYVVIDIGQPRDERPEPFRSAARFGEVPLLTGPAGALMQSDAILCWIAEHHGVLGSEPDASPDRMLRVREWLFWEANRLGMSLPQLRYARRFASQDYPPGALDWLRQRYDTDIARLDAEFATTNHAFIVGDTVSIADCALAGYLFWADEAELPVPPHVAAWLQRLRDLPGWRAPYDLLAA